MALKFHQTAVLVHGLRTELIVQPFADRILVLVTQTGKIGSLIQASIPPTMDLHALRGVSDAPGYLPSPPPAIQLTPIFGTAPSAHLHTLYSLYTTQIATLVWSSTGGEPRDVIVGIALKGSQNDAGGELCPEVQQTFHAIMQALRAALVS